MSPRRRDRWETPGCRGFTPKRPAPTLSALTLVLATIISASFWRIDTPIRLRRRLHTAGSRRQGSGQLHHDVRSQTGRQWDIRGRHCHRGEVRRTSRRPWCCGKKQLAVRTVPPVGGSWYWIDNQRAHWRPQSCHSPGHRGRRDLRTAKARTTPPARGSSRVSFRIGESHVSVADDATKQIRVYRNDELVRTIPTSMGMGGSETVAGKKISFWTQPRRLYGDGQGRHRRHGLLHLRPAGRFTAGLQADGEQCRTTHQQRDLRAPTRQHGGAQGKSNTSHGCLNVNADNGRWFYEFSPTRRRVRSAQLRRRPIACLAERRLGSALGQVARGSALR